MKRLYFVRHAKAENEIFGHKDFDRELAYKGQVDAPRIAQNVAQNSERPQLLVSSAAARAVQTSILFAEQLGYSKADVVLNDAIYDASARTLLNVVNSFDDNFDCIMMFGHNPSFSHLVEYVTKDVIGKIPTCGVVFVQFEVACWGLVSANTASIKATWFPEKVQ